MTVAVTVETASAQQLAPPVAAPRYRVRAVPATLGIALPVGAWLAAKVWERDLPYARCAPCDPSGLPGIDRGILGPVRPGVANASDLTLLGTVGAAGSLLALGNGPRATRAADVVVLAQTLSVTSALTAWGKIAFHRPRPVRYTAAGDSLAVDQGLSFPSGHASLAFAAAAAYASIGHRRGVGGRRTATVLLFAGAATTAVLRVSARRHFPTDVAAGALLGGLAGWIVPAVYPLQ